MPGSSSCVKGTSEFNIDVNECCPLSHRESASSAEELIGRKILSRQGEKVDAYTIPERPAAVAALRGRPSSTLT